MEPEAPTDAVSAAAAAPAPETTRERRRRKEEIVRECTRLLTGLVKRYRDLLPGEAHVDRLVRRFRLVRDVHPRFLFKYLGGLLYRVREDVMAERWGAFSWERVLRLAEQDEGIANRRGLLLALQRGQAQLRPTPADWARIRADVRRALALYLEYLLLRKPSKRSIPSAGLSVEL